MCQNQHLHTCVGWMLVCIKPLIVTINWQVFAKQEREMSLFPHEFPGHLKMLCVSNRNIKMCVCECGQVLQCLCGQLCILFILKRLCDDISANKKNMLQLELF